jgi:putative FmdB family regulatory protein
MPVYEYQCKKCGREFEYQQRMSDPEKTLCEACGAEALERMISRTAFSLKGGGWYKDLYASSKPEKSGDAASGTDAPAAPAADAKTATPAAPAAATPSTTPAPTAKPSGGSTSGGSSSGGSSSGGSSSGGSSSGGSSSDKSSTTKPSGTT